MSALSIDISVRRRTRRGESFELQVGVECAPGITVVCGASGAGKSTLLLSIVGALASARGRLVLDGEVLLDSERGVALPVRRRRVGMVFQDVPLFPHRDVLGNVAFGIRGPDRAIRARRLLDRVGAGELARRLPHELSGGQAQRVALARALGAEPRALLLDEPLSALDVEARASLGELLVTLQRECGIPFVHVTHDLAEALRVGTQLVLLDRGRVVQSGVPAEVIARPVSRAAARAVGTENILSARVLRHLPDEGCTEVEADGTVFLATLLDSPPGSRITLGLRAEDILLSLHPVQETSARNVIPATIRQLHDRGHIIELHVTTPAPLRVLVTPASARSLRLTPDTQVHLLIKATSLHALHQGDILLF